MGRRSASSLLVALGFPAELDQIYQRLLPLSGGEVQMVASALNRPSDELLSELAPLLDAGIARVVADRLRVLDHTEAVAHLLDGHARHVARLGERVAEVAAAVPFLTAAVTRPGPADVDDVHALDGEVSSGGNPLDLLTAMVANTRGDLLWLRPDQWRLPRESSMARVIAAAIASGRRSRAIYPAMALQQAPEVLRARAEAGEQIRVLSEVPTRMIVFGHTHAVLPEPLGFGDEPRLLVRQGALVAALSMLFEHMWDRAAPVPELDLGEARPDLRRFLLEQLAEGVNDEQIARTLGISLRTVRRRVASVMVELGADTRFQAGVEAVRRGWL